MNTFLFLFGPWDLAGWSIAVMLALIAVQMCIEYVPGFFDRRLIARAELERLRALDHEAWLSERLLPHSDTASQPAADAIDAIADRLEKSLRGRG